MLENNGGGSQPSTRNGSRNGTNGSSGSPLRRQAIAATNGTSKSTAVNGSSRNGKEPARSPQSSTYHGHDREEVTRLLIQALGEMGYQEAAASVGRDSGIELENTAVSALRTAILEGDWARAEDLLNGAVYAGRDHASPRSGNLMLASYGDINQMRFCIRRQKYLELIQVRDKARALVVLRNELTPLCQEQPALQVLAGYLMCRDSSELMAKSRWDGMQGQSRSELLAQLAHHISPSVMLPEHRLADLLQQVKTHQLNNCVLHTSGEKPSLYADHHCNKQLFPTVLALELTDQTNEVWQVAFSHDGTKMASCGNEDFVLIWDVPTFQVLHRLETVHAENKGNTVGLTGIGCVVWSPDDSMIFCGGRDHSATIWNTATGAMTSGFEPSSEPVTCCAWTPDGRELVIGTLGVPTGIAQWNVDGILLHTFNQEERLEGLALSADGRWLVANAYIGRLLFYNYQTRELEAMVDMGCRVTSISICEDSKYVLVHKQDGDLFLMELADRETRARYLDPVGPVKGSDFAIRAGFGGANESYVISGSEDGHIFIWHKYTGFLIRKLQGHTPRTNYVDWNPVDTTMFASCGDDGKIKIWTNPEAANRLRESRWKTDTTY